ADPGSRRGVKLGRWASRVRGLGEVYGELPVACLAEELDTPGEGQARALITIAGNPALSTPNPAPLDPPPHGLDFLLSLHLYLNDISRHAEVILPGPSPLERSHYDVALYQLAVRNVANYTPALLPHDGPHDWEIMLRLTGIVAGVPDVAALDDFVAAEVARRA